MSFRSASTDRLLSPDDDGIAVGCKDTGTTGSLCTRNVHSETSAQVERYRPWTVLAGSDRRSGDRLPELGGGTYG